MSRRCVNPDCSRPISECNGFIVARDFLAFLEKQLSAQEVRELCGRCILKYSNNFERLEQLLAITAPQQADSN